MRKRIALFFGVIAASFIINIIPLFVFREMAVDFSFVAFAFMILSAVKAGLAFFLRHKGNILVSGWPRGLDSVFMLPDEEHTFTSEYRDRFYWMYLVFCAVIPFYIPCIFFPASGAHTLWPLFVFVAPYIVYIAYGSIMMFQKVKKDKAKKQQLEMELKKQQIREEMGKFR